MPTLFSFLTVEEKNRMPICLVQPARVFRENRREKEGKKEEK